MTLTWHVWVDWDGDGVYEADEGGRLYKLQVRRGRTAVVKRDGHGFEPPEVGSGVALLVDPDGRYDTWNESSPIYPHFTANKDYRIEVSDGLNTWPVMAGRIKAIKREERDMPVVRLDLEDGWARLEQEVYIPMQRDVRTDVAMGMILDTVGWPADKRDIAAGDVHVVWWQDGETARHALHKLAEAEYGILVMRGDGTLWFRNRHEVYSSMMSVTGADIQRGYRIPLPWETVRTVARVRAYMPQDVSGTLAVLYPRVQVPGGSTEEVFVSIQDVYVDTVTSIAVTATENNDGTGADLSGQVVVTATLLSPQRVKLSISNTGAQGVWLQSVALSGTGVTMDNYVDREAQNDTGIGLYGERLLIVDNMWLQDSAVAWDLATHYASWYGNPAPERALLELQLKANPALQFGIDVGDVVRVQVGSIDADYRLWRIEQRWLDRAGQLVETKWLLQPVFSFTDTYWFFPTTIGVSSRFGF